MGEGPLPREAVPKLRLEAGRGGPGVGDGHLGQETLSSHAKALGGGRNGVSVPGTVTTPCGDFVAASYRVCG